MVKLYSNIARATLGRNFDVTIGRTGIWIPTHEPRKTTKSLGWTVVRPPGCKLNSSQHFGAKYMNPTVSPYLAVASFVKLYILVLQSIRLNNIYQFSSYLTGNTLRLR
jgi:hypothetical protein